MANKFNCEAYISDNILDMSLLQLTELPAKNKMNLPKSVNNLYFSNNMLISIPPYLCTFIQIKEIDLSKNKLKSLPDQFGDLVNLRKLDLYDNQLSFLPLSFYKLQKLKWLDISSNPIPQALMSIAGPCQNSKECENAAQNIVKYFGVLNVQVGKEFEKAKKAEKEKAETEVKTEPIAVTKSKKQKKKSGEKKDRGKVAEVKEVQTSAPMTGEKQTKRISFWRYLFFYTFAFVVVGLMYTWGNNLNLQDFIQCLKTGLNCTQLFLN